MQAIEGEGCYRAERRLEAVREGRSTTILTELVEDELDAIVARASQATRAAG